jgi:processive 1,2-diacylglycerol beta-glucosyltransferase
VGSNEPPVKSPKRVLFLSANMGTGHSSAAEAILRALRERESDVEARIINSFQYASQYVGKVVEDSYIQILKSLPTLYGFLYESRDRKRTVSGWRRWINQRFAGNFKSLVDTFRPNVVVCTHAFPFGVMSAIKEKFSTDVPCLGVVTDFVVHPFWLYENMDMYAVATPELAANLVTRGVDDAAVRVTGIPIDPRFGGPHSRHDLRAKLRLDGDMPVMLVMGGGLGMGPVGKILRSLERIQRPMHVVILTGKNDKLRERLQESASTLSAARVQTYGYIDNVYEYMHAADLLVTKPGGLTSAEALAAGLPMVIVHPLPGPEMRNTKYLLSKRVAVRVAHERNLHRVIEDMLDDPDALAHMREVSQRLACPDSARRAASLVLQMLGEPTVHMRRRGDSSASAV